MKFIKICSITFLCVIFFSPHTFALPPKIEADRLLLRAKKSIESKDFESAVKAFEKIKVLGVSVPDDFYYHYAKSLSQLGSFEKAKDAVEEYLNKAGQQGRFYHDALEIYSLWEDMQDPEKKEKMEEKRAMEKLESQYVDNGNGTITDTKSGFMWAKEDSYADLGKCLDWNQSKEYVGGLTTGGAYKLAVALSK